MDPVPLVVALAALACGAAAWALTPWARRLVASDSRWLHRAIPAALGILGGAAAVLAATSPAHGVGLGILAIACALLAPVDLATERLPDALVLPALGGLLASLVVASAITGDWARLGTAVLAALAAGLGYFALAWISPSSMGLGDVKLALPLGLALGWHGWLVLLVGVLAAFVLLLVAALVLLVVRRSIRGVQVPFGPLLMLGVAAAIAWTALR